MKTYKWARISRKNVGLDDIILYDVTVAPSQLKNIVTVSGKQRVRVETKSIDDLPKKQIEKDLSKWDPRRLFGIKTRVVEVPDETGWTFECFSPGVIDIDMIMARYELQPRSYTINSVWLELSAE